MRNQIHTENQILSAIALFCYSSSLVGLFAIGYSLIALALNVASQEITVIYSQGRM